MPFKYENLDKLQVYCLCEETEQDGAIGYVLDIANVLPHWTAHGINIGLALLNNKSQ